MNVFGLIQYHVGRCSTKSVISWSVNPDRSGGIKGHLQKIVASDLKALL